MRLHFKTLKIIFSSLCLVWVHLALSQKTLEEVIPVDDIEGILIDTDLVFDVNIQAVAGTDDIQIHTEVEGETFETLLIQTTIEDGILTVHTARSPSFKKIDDIRFNIRKKEIDPNELLRELLSFHSLNGMKTIRLCSPCTV